MDALIQWIKEFIHNAIIQPLMVFLPVDLATWMHDRNADWAFGSDRFDETSIEYG